MSAILKRMPCAIPGALNRAFEATVEAGIYQANALPIGYGVPLTVDATTRQYRGLTAGDTSGAIIGFGVRPYPTAAFDYASTGGPSAQFPEANVMKRGYIGVLINNGVAAKGGAVYCRIAGASGTKVVGGIEATPDATNTIQVPNCYFTGSGDSNGLCEVAYNL